MSIKGTRGGGAPPRLDLTREGLRVIFRLGLNRHALHSVIRPRSFKQGIGGEQFHNILASFFPNHVAFPKEKQVNFWARGGAQKRNTYPKD